MFALQSHMSFVLFHTGFVCIRESVEWQYFIYLMLINKGRWFGYNSFLCDIVEILYFISKDYLNKHHSLKRSINAQMKETIIVQ
jgi:hypothetical protein